MKRIAIFSDGTWNSPEQGGATNPLLMARAVAPDADGIKQVTFYDWGVGTDRKSISGALAGAGIDKNIMDCYRFLVHNHEPGDRLYLFGFSRGAYTVRSLAGFIRNCGLLKREYAERIPDAYRLYRNRSGRTGPNAARAVRFRRDHAVADITPIEFVGVFDTVGSLGIPLPFWGPLDEDEYLFHDTEPSKIIRHARHAVAIDETREDFEPALWTEKAGLDIEQVWFAGTHSDIGGGYRESGLSDCAGRWMLDEAQSFGLEFEPYLADALKPDALDKLHNERKGLYRLRGETVRRLDGPLHASVKERWDADVHGYRRKSRALNRFLKEADSDWNRIRLVA